jgi:hypothetical protein
MKKIKEFIAYLEAHKVITFCVTIFICTLLHIISTSFEFRMSDSDVLWKMNRITGQVWACYSGGETVECR